MKPNRLILIGVAVLLVAAIALLLSGRDQPATTPTAKKEIPAQPEPQQAPKETTADKIPPPAAEQSEPADVVEPVPVVGGTGDEQLKALVAEEVPVDWDAANQHPRLDTAQLSVAQKDTINEAPVPVLLPDQPKLLGSAQLTTGPSWYAASMQEDDASVYVSGNAKVVRVPGAEAYEPPTLGEDTLTVNRAEGMVEISFKAFGIYYDFSVECYDHENDPRCTDDHYALQLVNELKLAPPDNQ